ncbi:hypothetical protein LX32DRAFT_32449 [Colletotrichum zoysiae]|uniref:Uncharacterized protein n=1 Tax=Colletotrichum zoysiae TaxID=1216348 RepID=A0AAD9HCE7_9PEZI|nr:hypothetical protein LX32DRAFT_32449 [Colletotrichum zoysiae]
MSQDRRQTNNTFAGKHWLRHITCRPTDTYSTPFRHSAAVHYKRRAVFCLPSWWPHLQGRSAVGWIPCRARKGALLWPGHSTAPISYMPPSPSQLFIGIPVVSAGGLCGLRNYWGLPCLGVTQVPPNVSLRCSTKYEPCIVSSAKTRLHWSDSRSLCAMRYPVISNALSTSRPACQYESVYLSPALPRRPAQTILFVSRGARQNAVTQPRTIVHFERARRDEVP